jgi:hypothetical protein
MDIRRKLYFDEDIHYRRPTRAPYLPKACEGDRDGATAADTQKKRKGRHRGRPVSSRCHGAPRLPRPDPGAASFSRQSETKQGIAPCPVPISSGPRAWRSQPIALWVMRTASAEQGLGCPSTSDGERQSGDSAPPRRSAAPSLAKPLLETLMPAATPVAGRIAISNGASGEGEPASLGPGG